MADISKVVASADAAIADIESGASIAVGGFGLSGIPTVLIKAVLARQVGDFTVVSNNCGLDDAGVGLWLAAGKISKMIASYVGENDTFERQYLSGELHVELTPQGTLAEKLRAGGSGIPAFFTPAGVGTVVADGGLPWRFAPDGSVAEASPAKEIRTFDGKEYVLEDSITTDFALVHARTVDTLGNCVFHAAARNFNVPAAMAGRITIVEAEEVVPAGAIDADAVHLPGIFVTRVVKLTPEQAADKRIERLTVRQPGVN